MLYQFSGFVLDSDQFVLLSPSHEPVSLQPRALELLLLLVREAGKMVSKETIGREVWGGLHVSRSALPMQVKALRRALGDDAKPHRFIETVHGRGLRFVGAVTLKETLSQKASKLVSPLAPPDEREGIASQLVGAQPTIAVLPFTQDETMQPHRTLGRSLAVDIQMALSRHRLLRVMARASSFILDSAATPLMVKSALGADYCLTGQVEQKADRYVIFVELSDTSTQHLVWSGQYELALRNLNETIETIVGRVVSQVERQVPRHEAQTLLFHQPDSLTAWQAFHVGEALILRRGEENFLRARQYFQRAVAIDPGFARAWSGLAHTYAFEVVHRAANESRWAQVELMKTVEKAIRADPDDPSANMMMGRAVALGSVHEPSEAWFLNAITLSPSYAEAHHQLGLALAFEDEPERAAEHSSASILLSPQGSERFGGYANLAVINFRTGNMANVIKYGRKAAQVPYDDGYALLAGMCAHHVAGEKRLAELVGSRFRRAFPTLSQKELFGLYDLGEEMQASISEIYSTYGIH